MMTFKHNILLKKYFRGTITPEELLDFQSWLNESLENQKILEESMLIFEQINSPKEEMKSIGFDKAKQQFKQYIESSEINKVQFRFNYRRWYSIAASIIILFSVSIYSWFKITESQTNDIAISTKSNTLEKILPDSTKVTLSENSNLLYCHKKVDAKRIIKLQGKANIDVAKSESGNVLVDVFDEVYVEDIGTVFTVSAYPDSSFVMVEVDQGKVNFYSKFNTKGIQLSANEIGIYNKSTRKFEKIIKKGDLGIGFVKGHGPQYIEFENKNLGAVIQNINSKYKTNIYFSDHSLEKKKISVTFDGEKLDVVLEVISEAMNLQVRKTSNGYLLEERNRE